MYYDRERAAEVDWSEEFQQRRIVAWRKSRLPFALLLVSGPAFLWISGIEAYAFGAFAAAIVWLTFVCTRYYTCPSCNKIPMSSQFSAGRGGISYREMVDFNPEFCSTCGVRLKPKIRIRPVLDS